MLRRTCRSKLRERGQRIAAGSAEEFGQKGEIMRRRPSKTLLIVFTLLGVGLWGPSAQAQRLHAYSQANFAGHESVFREAVPNLAAVGVQKIASVRVVTARWLICAGANFGGDCAWLSHDIRSLSDLGFTDQPGSLRPERVPVLMRHWGTKRAAPREKLALFERSNYDGDWTALADSVPDFDAVHLKSPKSVVIGDGTWRLCSGPNYTGRCLIVTGSAWDLDDIFAGQIHSARRVR